MVGVTARLHLFFTTRLPAPEDDAERLIVGIGFDGVEAPASEEIEYVTLLLSRYDDPDALARAVDEWWQERAGAPARLELLADHPAQLASAVNDQAARLESESWWLDPQFVFFRRDSAEARDEAIEVVCDEALAIH